jgi:hypothetical protein
MQKTDFFSLLVQRTVSLLGNEGILGHLWCWFYSDFNSANITYILFSGLGYFSFLRR